MNAFQIKVIAIILMIIDHIGLFFFPQYLELRLVGRLAFPLFAWLIANGAHHTHNMSGYLKRIFLFAFIAQIPYTLANQQLDQVYNAFNVLFTLGFGLTAIFVIQKSKNVYVWLLATVVCAAAAKLLNADYGFMGVASVVAFYIFFKNIPLLILSQCLIFLFPYFFLMEYKAYSVEPLALFALLILVWYNNKKGPAAKYLFYVIYPLQYVVIYLLLLWLR